MHWIKGRVTRQAHVDIPDGCVEEEFGRGGFGGKYAHLYRTEAPVGWSRIEGDTKPRAYRALDLPGWRLDATDDDVTAGRGAAALAAADVFVCDRLSQSRMLGELRSAIAAGAVAAEASWVSGPSAASAAMIYTF